MQRVAIVTGGIGGLGSAICRTLAQSGRTVIAADLDARAERIATFREEMADLGERVAFEPLNVADEQSCSDLVARVGGDEETQDRCESARELCRSNQRWFTNRPHSRHHPESGR